MKNPTTLLTLILLASTAQAYLIENRIYNYNTLQPVEGANITYDGNGTYTGLTDANGILALTINASGNFTLTAWRSGYDPINMQRDIDQDTTEDLYMNPASTSGIIRLTINDITLQDHGFCLYFATNRRLLGCYQLNDTVTIHNNMNYTLIPQVRRLDTVNSVDNAMRYLPYIIGPILGITVAGLLAFAMIMTLWQLAQKAWRKR